MPARAAVGNDSGMAAVLFRGKNAASMFFPAIATSPMSNKRRIVIIQTANVDAAYDIRD